MTPVFPFVQFEFTHSVGPPAGRYTLVGEDGPRRVAAPALEDPADVDGNGAPNTSIGSADVVVFQVLGAPPPAAKRFRRAAPVVAAEGPEPTELSLSVVTVIFATQLLSSEGAASRRHSNLRADPDAQLAEAQAALTLVRRCVEAYRAAAADPYVPDIALADARVIRAGYGPGAMVVRGQWSEAIVVVPPRGPKITRTGRLMPQQAAAAILAGSADRLESEDMVLAVLRDLDHGRHRAAAVTLSGALDLLLGELEATELPGVVASLFDQLEATQAATDEIAERAIAGQLTAADPAALRRHAETIGAFVDAWRYAPLGYA